MEREIIKDTIVLKRRSVDATKADINTAYDLMDTLKANSERCAGLAANMIGVNKNIIAVQSGFMHILMINPKMISHSEESYEAEEGCLSLAGVRKAKRYTSVVIEYYDTDFKKHTNTYSGFLAQTIQHELDHCRGILI